MRRVKLLSYLRRRRPGKPRDWIGRLLIVLGCLVTIAGVAYFGTVRYLVIQEQTSPSTSRVLVLRDGRRIPLLQPISHATASTPNGTIPQIRPPDTPFSTGVTSATGLPSPPPAQQSGSATATRGEVGSLPQILPPTRIRLPSINADWPVVLTNGTVLPGYKAAGWLLGSAFPGSPGNLVLAGHLDGPYATFAHLKDLHAGDVFYIYTDETAYKYRVRSAFETTPDDVLVMAPTDTATATLITCSGSWNFVDQMYDHRWIVSADYVGAGD